VAASLASIAWGALAFGAVYPWAYTPLALVCASIGIAALIVERRSGPRMSAVGAGLAAIGLAIALQLVPLSPATLERISPNTDAFLGPSDSSGGRGVEPGTGDAPLFHPLSIVPAKTLLGLELFAGFALFFLGLSRLVSAVGVESVARPIVYFGIVLALVGIVQWAATSTEGHPLIYGFWRPESGSRSFGPFVNPNHFAGWMLMVLPLALAAFYESLLRTLQAMPSHGRDRTVILSSRAFGSLLVYSLACMVMGLSLFMTRSRSGIAAFTVGSALAGWIVFRRQGSVTAKAAVAASFLLLLLGTVAWAGLDTITGKFVESDESLASVGGRVGAWKDTLGIVGRFPLTGTGLDTYGVAMVIYQTGSREVHFQEAHNDYLQLVAEGGLLVGVPVLFTLAIFLRDVRRRFIEAPKEGTTYWFRVGAILGLVSIGLQSLVEFSLQMPGNAALLAVLAAIAVHRSPNLRRAPRALEVASP
jgi:hypothetical protein